METLKNIVLSEIKALRPSFVSKHPHFNFISVHYFWIIGLSLLGSVLLYAPAHNKIRYIDALAFAAGGSTQAGLNTVDVNKLQLFQQIIIYLLAALSNPITINSFVVILRLYWFEKRFQNIVHEARLRRSTLSKSKAKAAEDISRLERGVNGRHITVMHSGVPSRVANDGTYLGPIAPSATEGALPRRSAAGADDTAGTAGTVGTDETVVSNGGNDANGSPARHGDGNGSHVQINEPAETRRPEIKFAPTVKRSDGVEDDAVKLPPQLTDEEHIAILERQRNPVDDEVLHIPGPRDAERGVLPSRVVRREGDVEDENENENEDDPAARVRKFSKGSSESVRSDPLPEAPHHGMNSIDEDTEADDENDDADAIEVNRAQAITIQEPEKPSRVDDFSEDARAVANVFASFGLRWPDFLKKKKKRKHGRRDSNLFERTTTWSKRLNLKRVRTAFSRDDGDPAPYLSWQPTLGRNSAFIGLSDDQREELGGIEYRSLKTLGVVLFIYFWGFWLLGVVCLLPWIVRSQKYGAVVDAAGEGRVWWGFFTSHSAFMDLGFTLTPDSMNSFNTAVFPLLLMSFLIVIGNTGFPVMLRFMIWVFSILAPRGSGAFEELKFLLDHPRRCFTLLFPSGATWWLFWLLVILNGIDLLFFIILDLGNGPINDLPAGVRVLDGLFQAFSTRTAGFSCVNLSTMHPAVQASYLIMMYISVFPIAISVRRTNVYEEKSLGVYSDPDVDEPANGTDLEYVGAHLRRQLSFDLWFLSIGFFILTISEGTMLQKGGTSMFAVLFEVVSAYGTVGLSIGYSNGNESLCSQFSVVGKLVIIAMMIRGRHRGLPYGLDRAILLPSESLNAKESADADAHAGPLLMTAPRRASTTSIRTTQTGNLRGTSANRGRQTSRSIDRVNSNIISQFLHPGPAVMHNPLALTPPRRSSDDLAVDENTAHATGVDTTSALNGRLRQ